MSPEQASGRQAEIDARSDIFAIGATAFMILANRGVHEAQGVIELVARMGTLPAPRLRDVAPHVSELVARIVDRALEFKREDRYPSAAAMRADVVSVLASRRSMANVVPESVRGAVSAPPAPPPISEKTRADAPRALREVSPDDATVIPSEPPRSVRSRGSSRGWLVLLALVGAGIALLVLVPRAREQSGVDGALGQLMATGSLASGEVAPKEEPSARSLGTATPSFLPDASPVAVAVDELTDAAADAADQDAALDAGDDEEDDDDDVDASDIAAITVAREAGAPSAAPGAVPGAARAAVPQHPVVKRPRAAPAVKHKGPRRPRRPRRR
jgi:hypothetical protein